MESNDITVRPAKCQVILGDGTIHNYGSQQPVMINSTACRTNVLHSPATSMTIWPGEFLTASQLWPQPTMVSSVTGKIRIPNLTPEPNFLKMEQTLVSFMPSTQQKPTAATQSCQSHHHPGHQNKTPCQMNVTLDPNNITPSEYQS